MDEKEQILYMQTRLSRTASEKWGKSMADVINIYSLRNRHLGLETQFGQHKIHSFLNQAGRKIQPLPRSATESGMHPEENFSDDNSLRKKRIYYDNI